MQQYPINLLQLNVYTRNEKVKQLNIYTEWKVTKS